MRIHEAVCLMLEIMKFFVNGIMSHSDSNLLFVAGVKLTRSERIALEGTAGAMETLISVDTSSIDHRLPTPETMKQLYNGIPFDELPIVFIKASKNNTLVMVTDYKFNIITYTSCRLEGFKNARKKTTIAGQTTGVAAGQRLVRRGIRTVRVQVRRFYAFLHRFFRDSFGIRVTELFLGSIIQRNRCDQLI
ncbi:unnamed protein product [Anisakis simplex]|uniref:28S ribosomal protein S11, mitochondrial (inferred by orthology to a human protein) n=1 Tax=Anisakis simplex TaxID=6269 RepID=A0A0M3J9L9_ANISI|nr:unnamed protein product [Anisakis simplex]